MLITLYAIANGNFLSEFNESSSRYDRNLDSKFTIDCSNHLRIRLFQRCRFWPESLRLLHNIGARWLSCGHEDWHTYLCIMDSRLGDTRKSLNWETQQIFQLSNSGVRNLMDEFLLILVIIILIETGESSLIRLSSFPIIWGYAINLVSGQYAW